MGTYHGGARPSGTHKAYRGTEGPFKGVKGFIGFRSQLYRNIYGPLSRGVPKIRGTFLRVPRIRTIAF